MTQQTGDDNAKRARRHTERVIRSLRPPTRLGKLVVWAAPYVVGPAVEYGVRLAEERGPELAGMGAAIVKEKAPEVAHAAKAEVVAAAHVAREKVPEAAHAAVDTVVSLAQRVQARRR
jgi:hypothetical protein